LDRRAYRPKWINGFQRQEWALYDSQTDKLMYAKADTQKEAIKKALNHGIVPRSTEDVYPWTGGEEMSIMTPREFEQFMSKLKK
jgi:phosphopantetheinyl transferase (holo-ACP synthase)